MNKPRFKIGDLVKTRCKNKSLNSKSGVVVLNEECDYPYGLCVMIDGKVYGFSPEEIFTLNEIN